MRWTNNLGMLCLAIWLILTGLAAYVGIGALSQILPLLAIAAGVLILIGR